MPRGKKGATNSQAILDDEKVSHIRWKLAHGYNQQTLATQYSVSRSCIAQIANWLTWPDVQPKQP